MLLKIHSNTMKTAIMFHQPNIFSPIFIISEKGKRGPKTSFAVESPEQASETLCMMDQSIRKC